MGGGGLRKIGPKKLFKGVYNASTAEKGRVFRLQDSRGRQ